MMRQLAANASMMLRRAKAAIKDAGHKTAPWESPDSLFASFCHELHLPPPARPIQPTCLDSPL